LSQICKIRNVWKLSLPFSRNTLIPYSEKSSFWKKSYHNFSGVKVLWFWDFFLEYPKTMKFRDLQRSLTWRKFFMTVFEFIGHFFIQNDVFKLQEAFSEYEISVLLEHGLVSCPEISYFLDLRQTSDAKKIPKTVLKTRLKSLKPKKPRIL
jgi:hypothetical protein